MNQQFKHLFLIGLFCAFCLEGIAQLSQDSLKILNWNIYMLPVQYKDNMRTERAEELVHFFNNQDYDILILQEVFMRKAERILTEGLKNNYPFQIRGRSKRGLVKTNSGIYFFSKHPIKFIDDVVYSRAESEDAFARKGATLIEMDFHGRKIQFAGTHLQAGGENAAEIRVTQTKEMAFLLDQNKSNGVMQIAAGDFNINYYDKSAYQKLKYAIQPDNLIPSYEKSSPHAGWQHINYNRYALIDYIFIRPNGNKYQLAEESSAEYFYGKDKKPLSDHMAIESVIVF